jgi:putative addiction module component (TIGR02574 family)
MGLPSRKGRRCLPILLDDPGHPEEEDRFILLGLSSKLHLLLYPKDLSLCLPCANLVFERRSVMHRVKEIIEEAASLPVEERVTVIDSLLQTINPSLPEVEAEWMGVAKRRLAEMRSGQVKAVPGNEVFDRIRRRFEK